MVPNREAIFDNHIFRLEPYGDGLCIITLNSKFVGFPVPDKDGLILIDWLKHSFIELNEMLGESGNKETIKSLQYEIATLEDEIQELNEEIEELNFRLETED